MSEENVEPSEALEAFKVAALRSAAAFNQHDFESAFALLPDDIEWVPLERIPGAHPLLGRKAVVDWFRQVAIDFSDFRCEFLDFIELAPGTFVVQLKNQGTGRSSGAAVVGRVVNQLWESARDPWRVREYESLNEARAAAGLSE